MRQSYSDVSYSPTSLPLRHAIEEQLLLFSSPGSSRVSSLKLEMKLKASSSIGATKQHLTPMPEQTVSFLDRITIGWFFPLLKVCYFLLACHFLEKNSCWRRRDINDPWRKMTYGVWMTPGRPRLYRRNSSESSIRGARLISVLSILEVYLGLPVEISKLNIRRRKVSQCALEALHTLTSRL